jgi:EmrB/QacA subfamily drug resistance transporter
VTAHPPRTQRPITPTPIGFEESPYIPEGKSRWVLFGIVAIALFMSSLDLTIVATALPAIHHRLHASINWVGWIITIYSFGMVIVLPLAGKFSDHFGRRRIFLCSIALFTTASLLCGFSTDIYMLIAFRGLQAIGAGAIQPSAAAILATHFGRNRDRAIGMFGTIAASGQIVGPILGGLLVSYLSWRWIFFVNIPIGIVLVGLITRFIPESRVPLAGMKTDVTGLLLMTSSILAAVIGITELGSGHTALDAPIFLVPEAAAVFLLTLFVRHSKRIPEPFIALRLLVGKGFAVMNAENLMWGAFGFGVASLVPLYAEQRYRFGALDAGTLLTARAVGMMAVGAAAAFALRRTGYRMPMMVGYGVVAVGTLLMSVAPNWGVSPYAWLSVGAGITGIGNGIANPASRNATLKLSPDDVAALTGLCFMFQLVGIIFSVSIITAILNRSATPGIAQAHALWVVAGALLFVMVPLVLRVPEHKGSW